MKSAYNRGFSPRNDLFIYPGHEKKFDQITPYYGVLFRLCRPLISMFLRDFVIFQQQVEKLLDSKPLFEEKIDIPPPGR